jgi:hypothetical protein
MIRLEELPARGKRKRRLLSSSSLFAVVVPTSAETAALRVPRRVRELLRIDVYTVGDDGKVMMPKEGRREA